MSRLYGHKVFKLLLGAFLLAVVLAFLEIFFAMVLKTLAEWIIAPEREQTFFKYKINGHVIILLFLFVGLLRTITVGIYSYHQSFLGEEAKLQTKSNVLRWAFSTKKFISGNVASLIHERSNNAALWLHNLQIFYFNSIQAVCFLAILFYLSPIGALILIITLLLISFFFKKLNLIIEQAAKNVQSFSLELNTSLFQAIKNVLLIKILSISELEKTRISKKLYDLKDSMLSYHKSVAAKFVLPQFVGIFLVSVLLWFLEGDSNRASLIPFLYMLFRFLTLGAEIVRTLAFFRLTSPQIIEMGIVSEERESFETIEQMLESRTKFFFGSDGVDFSKVKIKVHNAEIGYEASDSLNQYKKIFENLSFSLSQGDFLFVSGESGCGKSTLMAALLGRLKPRKGKIFWQFSEKIQIDASELPSKGFQKIAYAGPDPYLRAGSILENLTYGNHSDLRDSFIEHCISASDCEFIWGLNGKLNYVVDELGTNLSAGQKQRLALCRALLRSPYILFLDEACSNISWNSEKKILASLSSQVERPIIIYISHRPIGSEFATSTLTHSDDGKWEYKIKNLN